MNLTPEQIQAWLNSQNALYGTDASQGNQITGVDPRKLTGFAQSVDPTHYQMWDAEGNDKGVQERTPDNFMDKYGGQLTLAAIAAMTGAGLLNGGAAVPGAELANTVPGVFNPAVDSQLANLAGGLAPYSGAIPSAVDLGAAGGLLSTGELASTAAGTLAGTEAAKTAAKTLASKGAGLLGELGATDLAKIAAIGLGAAAGSKPTTTTSTAQSKTDPRIDPYIYGDDGILAQAKKWQQANQTGLNSQMLEGLNMQYNVNANPENMGAYQQMQRLGSGLMSSPIAGNPFTSNGSKNLGFSNQNAGLLTPNASPYKQPTYMK